MSDDLNQQNYSTHQSDKQPTPATVASATTIAPTTGMSLVSGTTNIATITPPLTGYHMLALIFTNAAPPSLLTTGNILVGSTTITQNVPVLLFYEPSAAKYYMINGSL